ncbi:MAG TPA: precorrin-3B C(17)-methyltransferase [Stellaceae bacterium]|nr:precorrin-3B C(17)-methyltransferase [Stellaceae bacterium]
MTPAIFVLGPSALALARRLRRGLPGAEIHGPAGLDGVDLGYARAATHLRKLFRSGRPILGLCASGILLRALAPLLRDKIEEPPVVAMAEDGSVAVPLLGGHRGANALAREAAGIAGGTAAITTASELGLGIALDAPPPGWRVANPARAKPLMAKLLAGKRVTAGIDSGNAEWLTRHPRISTVESGAADIRVTDRVAGPRERALVLHPPVLALGVGASRGCPPEELARLARRTLAAAGLADAAVGAVVSIDLKMDEPAVTALADRLCVPARFFSAAELLRETPRLANPSGATFRATGCWGVAEGAALAAVGKRGELAVTKRKSRHATCAIARAPVPLDPQRLGHARGSLAILGIGPGDPGSRTPEVSAALAAATDVVGYGLYLDLLGPALAGKRRHARALGAETARARLALDLAAKGRSVALVSSGDAGIYGLASLVFELLDREGRSDWQRVALSVLPGVSAMQMAAARAGAPLGHDFAAISLSDLLTPWPAIERRLEAAARGDFVLALYNPRSARRKRQFQRARQILLRHRAAETPVVIARNLGRTGERVRLTSLGNLDPRAVDMLTLVLIGSSTTRYLPGERAWVYTPRGYARKVGR